MSKILINAVFCLMLVCTCVTLAQEPVQNIDPQRNPNLAAAQGFIAQANNAIKTAQQSNGYDMHGHAQRARELLAEASNELKSAALDANRR